MVQSRADAIRDLAIDPVRYSWLDALDPLRRSVLLAEEAVRRTKEERLRYYSPYKRQRDFHKAGATYRERLFMAGNQLGKTLAGGAEMAMHLTGNYPAWWRGRRFAKPIRAWAASKTGEVTRDSVQKMLVGNPENENNFGTGMVPKHLLVGWAKARGVPNALASITVKHASGGESNLIFKAYDQGREKWQGETLNIVWFDEEPPQDIYTEGVTRTNATGGMVYLTFTPLLGMSEVVRMFLHDEKLAVANAEHGEGNRHVTRMTLWDVDHYTDDARRRILASYPAHERDARSRGIPMLGSGRVFPVDESLILVEPFNIPLEWPAIGGIDFGYDHPTGGVKLVYDGTADCAYIVNEYRVREKTPIIHYGALRAWGKALPWAWPHDGYQRDKQSGKPIAKAYRELGLRMLGSHATFPDGSTGLEAAVMDMLTRMQTGRLKVFSTCPMWIEEFRLYHRNDGQIVREHDDLISASRYAIMMLRYARSPIEQPKADMADATYEEFV